MMVYYLNLLLTLGLYMRLFIETAFESNLSQSYVSLTSPINNILNDEKSLNDLQDQIFKSLEYSSDYNLNPKENSRGNVKNRFLTTISGHGHKRPNSILNKTGKKVD